jgi:hypothetical protein
MIAGTNQDEQAEQPTTSWMIRKTQLEFHGEDGPQVHTENRKGQIERNVLQPVDKLPGEWREQFIDVRTTGGQSTQCYDQAERAEEYGGPVLPAMQEEAYMVQAYDKNAAYLEDRKAQVAFCAAFLYPVRYPSCRLPSIPPLR